MSLLSVFSVRALGSSEYRIQLVLAYVPVLENRIAHDADNSAPSSAEVKNAWTVPPLNYNSV